VTPVRTAFALALCGPACAIPSAPHQATFDPPGTCARPHDVAVEVVSDPRASAEKDDARDDDACASFCAELGAACPGRLTGPQPCIEACRAWPEAVLECREAWLVDGSCIGAALDSPTCAT
jgi:hypothetical protein